MKEKFTTAWTGAHSKIICLTCVFMTLFDHPILLHNKVASWNNIFTNILLLNSTNLGKTQLFNEFRENSNMRTDWINALNKMRWDETHLEIKVDFQTSDEHTVHTAPALHRGFYTQMTRNLISQFWVTEAIWYTLGWIIVGFSTSYEDDSFLWPFWSIAHGKNKLMIWL